MSHDFQMSEDGRLIIHEEEEEMDDAEAKGTAWLAGGHVRLALVLCFLCGIHMWELGGM